MILTVSRDATPDPPQESNIDNVVRMAVPG